MNSAYLRTVGSAGGAFAAHADTIPASAAATMIRLARIIRFLGAGRRQSLDEAARHVGLDHDASVGGDVADDAGDPVQARDLLAVELLLAVEGDRNPARVECEARRHHLHE